MAAGLLARRDEIEVSVLHSLYRILGETSLGRIALIIGRVDRED